MADISFSHFPTKFNSVWLIELYCLFAFPGVATHLTGRVNTPGTLWFSPISSFFPNWKVSMTSLEFMFCTYVRAPAIIYQSQTVPGGITATAAFKVLWVETVLGIVLARTSHHITHKAVDMMFAPDMVIVWRVWYTNCWYHKGTCWHFSYISSQ